MLRNSGNDGAMKIQLSSCIKEEQSVSECKYMYSIYLRVILFKHVTKIIIILINMSMDNIFIQKRTLWTT